ncbi:MAG: hypothetical protein IPK07_19405 [Deltaproteobacteria bacterium]|nr:hypothetical protein [Deltaproteobacteria bacterium]
MPSKVGEPEVSYVVADPVASATLTVTDVPDEEGLDDLAAGRGVKAPGWVRSPRGDTLAEPPRASVRVGAQGLVTSFDAANFDTNPIYNSGYYMIPPDPNGAVGTNHLVSAVNSVVEFYTRVGTRTFISGLASFFSAFGPLTVTADPKVVYDPYADRFVLVVIERTDTTLGDAANTSRIFVAVSDDGDPNGTWFATQIDALTSIAGADRWIDFPGVAVDGQAIYITGNMFGFGGSGFVAVRLWVIGKSSFYSGGAAAVSKLDPYAGGGSATTTQPANTHGATPAGVGTFFVGYGGATLSGVQVLQLARIDDPLTSPTITQHVVPMGTIDANTLPLVDAPQSGSATGLNVGDRRTLAAVWRDGALWTTFNVRPPTGDPDAGQTTAHWVKLDTSNLASPAVVDQGNIGGESIAPGTHTFYPSVAVSSTGRAYFGFSASAPTIFAGSYWTMRAAGDGPGTTQTPSVLHAGTDYYVRKFSAARNRWGDYTGTAIDPSDGCAWVFNQYAMTRGTILTSEDGRWATTWGKVCPPTFTLAVGKAGGGAGTVTSVPAGVDCGPTCAASFDADTVVTLSATPAPGSTFTGWSGAGCSGTGTCVVTMDAAQAVTAMFNGPCGAIGSASGSSAVLLGLLAVPTLLRRRSRT